MKDKPSSGPEAAASVTEPKSDEVLLEQPVSESELDTVRKILFGRQSLEAEKRQASLERSIQEAMEATNQEIQNQLQALQEDLAALRKEVVLENQKQEVYVQSTMKRFVAVEQGMLKATEQTQKEHHEMEHRLHKETARLEHEISAWRKDIFHQLGQTQRQLQHDKADRKFIATLLNNMAEQLTDKNDNDEMHSDN